MIPQEWLGQAAERIRPHIHRTPLIWDDSLNTWIKWENRQITGSFKVRGAFNKVFILEPWESQIGLVAASAGNHGLGLALAGKIDQLPVVIFASENASPVKLNAIRKLGAEVRLVPGGYPFAETAGKSYAIENHMTWVSPYDDVDVIAGQGTLSLEILEQLPNAGEMTWLVPISGGGLISGIGVGLKERYPGAKLIGVQAAVSPFAYNLFYHGTQDHVQDLPSIADGLTGAIDRNSVTIPMILHYVDDVILVSEEEITKAIFYAWQVHGEIIEGSGAVGLAALLNQRIPLPAIVIISGGNIDAKQHRVICAQTEGIS